MEFPKLFPTMLVAVAISVPGNLVKASEKWPSTALEYYRGMEESRSKFIKNRSITIDKDIKTAVKDFWAESSDCFNLRVDTYGYRVIGYKKQGERRYTPSMRWVNKTSAVYGLQVLDMNAKGKDKALYMGGGKPPKDGAFIVATMFESAGKNKTRVTSYFPWGGFGKRIAKVGEKWAAGKKATCPSKYM